MNELKHRDIILKILTIIAFVILIIFLVLLLVFNKPVFGYICAGCLILALIFAFSIELTYRQLKVYNTIIADNGIDLQHITQISKLSTSEVEKHIEYLYNRGLIEKNYINKKIEKIENSETQNAQPVKVIERVIEKQVEVEKDISKCKNCGAILEYNGKIKYCPYCNAKFGDNKK